MGLPVLLRSLQEQVDAGEPLTHRVVDLPGQPGPLGERTGAALLLRQLLLGVDQPVEQVLAGTGLQVERPVGQDGQ